MSHAKLVSKEMAQLEAREKILADAEVKVAVGRDTYPSLELRAR